MACVRSLASSRITRVLRRTALAKGEEEDELLMLLEQGNLTQFEWFLEAGKTNLQQRNVCLAKACQLPDAVDYVRALLKAGVDVNSVEPHPAEMACHYGDLPLLKVLLQHPPLDVNVRLTHYGTILIWLCIFECKQRDTPLLLECLHLILDNNKLEVNIPDANGMVAIMYAVENDFIDRVLLLLKQKKHVLNLDVLLPVAGQNVRNNILSKFPDFKIFIPPPLKEDINSTDIQKRFLAALQVRDIDLFTSLCSQVDVNYFYGNPYHFTCLEFACQSKNCSEFVKVLLENGADPVNCKRAHSIPFVHFIVASCSLPSLELFIQDKRVNIWEMDAMKHTPLQAAANRRYTDEEDRIGLVGCTDRLLLLAEEQGQLDIINNQDIWGDTALHDSSLYGGDQITLQLLHHGASFNIENSDKQTPLSHINPRFLETYLDERIRSNDLSDLSERYKITFDYNFLRPPGGIDGPCEIAFLENMTASDLKHLLDHPVIHSYLKLKWQNMRCFYLLGVLTYFIFVLSMTVYIMLITYDRYGHTSTHKAPPQWFVKHSAYSCLSDNESVLFTVIISRSLYGITLQLLVLREVAQFLVQKMRYLQYWRNYFDILIIVIGYLPWLKPCMRYPLDAHVNSISILIAWTEFILLLGHMPLFCVQLHMLAGVAYTFLRFMTWYSLILIPFAVSFHIIFGKNMANFANPQRAAFRTVAMFTGQLDANSMEFSYVPVTSEVVFFLFVFLIAIILQNLISGLAVSDIQLIQANAKVLSHVALVEVLSRTERSLHTVVRWKPFRTLGKNFVIPRIRLFMGILKKRPQVRVLPNKKGRVLYYTEDAIPRKVYFFSSSITRAATDILLRVHKETKGQKMLAHHRKR